MSRQPPGDDLADSDGRTPSFGARKLPTGIGAQPDDFRCVAAKKVIDYRNRNVITSILMANGYEIDGKIHLIGEIQSFPSGFSKREFVVEAQDGRFSQMIKFECVKEKASLTDGFQVGEAVKVSFDIRGNEFKGRYFVNLNAWKIEKAGQSSGGASRSQSSGSGFADDESAPPSYLSEPPAGYGQDDDNSDTIPF